MSGLPPNPISISNPLLTPAIMAGPALVMTKPEKDALVESINLLDAQLQGFRDQLKAIRVALTIKGVIPRGHENLMQTLAEIPEFRAMIDSRATSIAKEMMDDLLNRAAVQKAKDRVAAEEEKDKAAFLRRARSSIWETVG